MEEWVGTWEVVSREETILLVSEIVWLQTTGNEGVQQDSILLKSNVFCGRKMPVDEGSNQDESCLTAGGEE